MSEKPDGSALHSFTKIMTPYQRSSSSLYSRAPLAWV